MNVCIILISLVIPTVCGGGIAIFKVPKTGTTSLNRVLSATHDSVCLHDTNGYVPRKALVSRYQSLPRTHCLWACNRDIYMTHLFRDHSIAQDVIRRCKIQHAVVAIRDPVDRFASEVYFARPGTLGGIDITTEAGAEAIVARHNTSAGGPFHPYAQYNPDDLGAPACTFDITRDGDLGVHSNKTPPLPITIGKDAFKIILGLFASEMREYADVTARTPPCSRDMIDYIVRRGGNQLTLPAQ